MSEDLREILSWYLANFLKLVLSEMGNKKYKSQKYGLNNEIFRWDSPKL